MNLKLIRYSDNGDDTLGLLFVDQKFFCYTLEDEYRKEKRANETRIKAGKYELAKRKYETKLTRKYRDKYPWFEWHIEVTNVPEFTGIYIHIGNNDEDTAGCILVGNSANVNADNYGKISGSKVTFEKFYKMIYNKLDTEKCTIEIVDLDRNI